MKKIIISLIISSILFVVLVFSSFALCLEEGQEGYDPVGCRLNLNFEDVDSSHMYSDDILYIKNEGISSGFSDGTYRPSLSIDRKSLMTMLVKASFPSDVISNCLVENKFLDNLIFSDIPTNHHFAPSLCVLKMNNIVVGYSDGTFRPDVEVNFEVATTVIMRTLDVNLEIREGSHFSNYIQRLESKSSYPPSLSQSDHQKNLNRGEMAYLIKAVLQNYPNSRIKPIYGFCGISELGSCTTHSSCVVDGCSGQVCRSWQSQPVITTCEWKSCYNSSLYGVSCGCFENKCQWK